MVEENLEEGTEHNLKVDAKGARGEGIGRIGDFVVFVKNAKTRIGNIYKVRVTKVPQDVRVRRTQGYQAAVRRQR